VKIGIVSPHLVHFTFFNGVFEGPSGGGIGGGTVGGDGGALCPGTVEDSSETGAEGPGSAGARWTDGSE